MSNKRRISVVVLTVIIALSLVVVPTAIPYSAAADVLDKGDRGPQVYRLQSQLKQLGYLKTSATGYFGDQTLAAVQKLQKDYYLKPDGKVGPLTKNALTGLLAGKTSHVTGNTNQGKAKTVMGYYTGSDPGIPSSYASLSANANSISIIAPFWYRLDPKGTGSLVKYNAPDDEIARTVKLARQNNIKVLALVHNLLYGNASGRDIARKTFTDPDKRWNLVTNIYKLVRDNGYHGVEIDIENIYPSDKWLFNQFMKELSAKLHPEGYYISVAVPARTSDRPNGGWGDGFDYATIGKYADQVVIMTYDEHGFSSGPGPIASLPWVNQVIKYTLTKIPAHKVMMGLSGYGFDWKSGSKSPRYLSHYMAGQIAQNYGRTIQWHNTAQVPYFTYTDKNGSWHQVYFENSNSWAAKLNLVNGYNLKGVAIWRLGMEDPGSWKVLRSKFPVKKWT